LRDEKEQEFDILLLGAGFDVSQYLWPVNYIGTEGMTSEKPGTTAHAPAWV
jgi:hypothetical protein